MNIRPVSHLERSEGRSLSFASLRMTLAMTLVAFALREAGAQATGDTLPRLQLGEGRWQPNGKPVAIPDSSGRPRASTTPWSVRFARSIMQRNPQTHRRWD